MCIDERIRTLKCWEYEARQELNSLNEEYKNLLVRMERVRNEIALCEKERHELEAQKVEVKKLAAPTKRAPRTHREANIQNLLANLSHEERNKIIQVLVGTN